MQAGVPAAQTKGSFTQKVGQRREACRCSRVRFLRVNGLRVDGMRYPRHHV